MTNNTFLIHCIGKCNMAKMKHVKLAIYIDLCINNV